LKMMWWMTDNLEQVSNWFINHRRRCPELREKREKRSSPSDKDD